MHTFGDWSGYLICFAERTYPLIKLAIGSSNFAPAPNQLDMVDLDISTSNAWFCSNEGRLKFESDKMLYSIVSLSPSSVLLSYIGDQTTHGG